MGSPRWTAGAAIGAGEQIKAATGIDLSAMAKHLGR